MKLFLSLVLLTGYANSKTVKIWRDTIATGHYEAQVQGDDGKYRLNWNLNPDSTFALKMVPVNHKGSKKANARGKWVLGKGFIHFWDAEQKTQDGWVPLELEPFSVIERNDTLLTVMVLHNKAQFILQKK